MDVRAWQSAWFHEPTPVTTHHSCPFGIFLTYTEYVCVILHLYPATCGPKGHGSGGATAVAVYIYDLFPGTSTGLVGHSRAPNYTEYVPEAYSEYLYNFRFFVLF